MTLALLLTAVAMSAQLTGVKITPKFQKGDSKLYRTLTTMNVGGQVINMVGEMRYTVTGATPAGYTLEVCLEKMDTDDQENLVGRIMTLNQGIMKGLKTVYTTDAEGVITDIKNFDEVKSAGKDAVEKMFDELTAELPEVAQILPKEAFVNQVDASLTKENVIASVQTNGFASKAVVWSVDDTAKEAGVTITQQGIVTIPEDADVTEITVTATSVYTPTVSDTATITIV